MQTAAVAAIVTADWEHLGPQLLRYAHYEIVGCRWRGLAMTGSRATAVTINNCTADEIVEEALEALAQGRRAYHADQSLEQNLRAVIWSLVRNHYKQACRSPIANHVVREDVDHQQVDLIENAPDPTLPANAAEADERKRQQREFCTLLANSVADDEELGLLLLAYEEGHYTPAKVAEQTGLAPTRISELKRKLEGKAEKILRQNPQYADIKPLQEVS